MQDKTYGIRLEQRHEQQLEVKDDALVWLEVAQCDRLERLIIDGQQHTHERHLTLSRVPKLKTIANPQQQPLVVHLDAYEREVPLIIEGPVAQFDFCWNGGEYAHIPATPLNRVMLMPVHLLPHYRHKLKHLDTDTFVVVYEVAEQPALAVMQLRTAAQLVITGVAGLQQLHLNSEPMASVQVRKCPNFEYVTGCGERLCVTDSGVNRLKVGGQWQQIELVSCGTHRLTIEQANELYLRGLCYIEEAHTPDSMRIINEATNWLSGDVFPDINESTLLALKGRLQASGHAQTTKRKGNTALVQTCLAAVRKCQRPKSRFHAIQILAMLAEWAPDMHHGIFEARRAMVVAGVNWWYPDDRYLEGWCADIRIWHALVQSRRRYVQPDSFYLAVMDDASRPAHVLYGVVFTLIEVGNERLLRLALRHLQSVTPASSDKAQFHETNDFCKAIKRLILALPKLTAPTQLAVAEFVLVGLRQSLLHEVVPKMLELAPAQTRKAGLRLANAYPEQRHRFLTVALAGQSPQTRTGEIA
ncbi:hypothetical protein [Pseudidiomarina terrestris]|uniref:hypothetical protein n=1 Tax=Pseudidiomarina terrestris TaxID=2820060 RepID=UPI002656C54A|nr:hypothetical protein [Pseudidiomarina sp. 1ASP75-5]MDN7135374.1 hypothetical protein [Pseudidiomarina sp. 1ASP75-5]